MSYYNKIFYTVLDVYTALVQYKYRPRTCSWRAYDGSEYHMPISLPSADALGSEKIGESVSQAVIGRYGRQDFAYEPGHQETFPLSHFQSSTLPSLFKAMVNITYDACELLFSLLPHTRI
jgi:hypothetical protein